MNVKESQQLRDVLARDTLARLERDRERADDEGVQRFLAYVGEHVFETGLTITTACEACSLPLRAFGHTFRGALGETPKKYVRDLRMEVVSRLLAESQLNQDEIAELVGLSSGSALRVAYKNATGETPSDFRARCHENKKGTLFDTSLGRRLLDGSLDHEEVKALLASIHTEYPQLVAHPAELHYCVDEGSYIPPGEVSLAQIECLTAEVVWSEMVSLSFTEQLEHIRQVRPFRTTALVDLLQHKIIEIGRLDRAQGVQIARLMLTLAFAHEGLDASARSDLRARAWAWVGNALRLNLELAEAERAFVCAEAFLPQESEPAIHGELLSLKAALCGSQLKPDTGLELANRAIPLIEQAGDRQALAKALLNRGLLLRSSGQPKTATEDDMRVLRLLAGRPGSELACQASYNIALSYCLDHQHELARELIPALKERCENRDFKSLGLSVGWLEGRLALEEQKFATAISLLKGVRSGFQSMKSELTAFVAVDLAIGYLQSRQPAGAIKLAGEALPMLALCRDQSAFRQTLERLEIAISRNVITLDLLVETRDLCDRLKADPRSRSLLKLKGAC